MKLFIAEKPELAKAIVEGLGGGQRKQGYYECGDNTVTWCFGHMLQLFDPEDYDVRYKQWQFSDLPISHIPWQKKPGKDKKEQLDIILNLLKKANSVVNAGDPDAEGQLLVDEILQYADCKLPTQRVLINDNNSALVKKALANLRDNKEFVGLSQAAEARSVGDQLYGYNLTRAYTLAARQAGLDKVLSVGRVQTPVLGLVVRRDLAFESHKKSAYYTVKGFFNCDNKLFFAHYCPKEGDPVDDNGRLINVDFVKMLISHCEQKNVIISDFSSEEKSTKALLPYNLLKLQTDASRLYGLKPDEVKEITQMLREKHRLITYNRSDSQYLSEEQHADAAEVLAAVAATASELSEYVLKSNTAIKGRAFNSKKVTAHHAIIPTIAIANFSALSENERHIYTLIARAYIAQFLPDKRYQQTDVKVTVDSQYCFAATQRRVIDAGWQVMYPAIEQKYIDTTENDVEDVNENSLEMLQKGLQGMCAKVQVTQKMTQPQPRYTMATLLTDLTRVAKYIKDPALRELLIAKDKDKAGEQGGIGTPATRDTIIKNLFERGFLVERGKNILSTPMGRELYALLPDAAKFPDMTALWHGQQQAIEKGELIIEAFIHDLMDYISLQVAEVKQIGLPNLTVENKNFCPECSKALRRIKGSKGYFWGCSGRMEGCKATFNDNNGIPEIKEKLLPSLLHNCLTCGKGLVRRPTKKGRFFWGCSGYPDCTQIYFDTGGKPNYQSQNSAV